MANGLSNLQKGVAGRKGGRVRLLGVVLLAGLLAPAATLAVTATPAWASGGGLVGPTEIADMGPLGSTPTTAVNSSNHDIDVFWMGKAPGDQLFQAQWTPGGGWSGPKDLGMGPLGSPPSAAVNSSNGDVYVFWEGANDGHLWEAEWTPGGGWSGPTKAGSGMGILGSEPGATVDSSNGDVNVFWVGSGAPHLWQAQWRPGAGWSGPTDLGMGPLGSNPSAVTNSSNGDVNVFWEGTGPADDLYEAIWRPGSGWTGPTGHDMGPLGGPPTATLDSSTGDVNVFWQGTGAANLWEASWAGSWSGPTNDGMGPLGSDPGAAVDSSDGAIDVFWQGTAPGDDLWSATSLPYEDPLRSVSGLYAERVDQGVDYSGSGPIYAIGDGTVLDVYNSGWPNGTFIAYQLSEGPAAGEVVYAAEDITPSVSVGDHVTSSTVLGTMFDGGSGIETGWANPDELGVSEASYYGQWAESNNPADCPQLPSENCSTAFGVNFNDLLGALGTEKGTVYPPVEDGSLPGGLPAGWPTW